MLNVTANVSRQVGGSCNAMIYIDNAQVSAGWLEAVLRGGQLSRKNHVHARALRYNSPPQKLCIITLGSVDRLIVVIEQGRLA